MESKLYTEGMDNFFEFKDKYLHSTVQTKPKNHKKGLDEELLRGIYENVHFPVIFEHEFGKNFIDILGTGCPNLYLISDKFKKILEESQFTGWKSYPIILLDKKGQLISGYNGFSITGTCDLVDFSHSKVIEKQFVKNGPIAKFYKGLIVTPNCKVDFFMAPESLRIYVGERAALILKKNKLKNLILTPINEIELDCINIDPYLRADKTKL